MMFLFMLLMLYVAGLRYFYILVEGIYLKGIVGKVERFARFLEDMPAILAFALFTLPIFGVYQILYLAANADDLFLSQVAERLDELYKERNNEE